MHINKYRQSDIEEMFALHVLAMSKINAYPGPKWDYDFKDIEGIYDGQFFAGKVGDKIVAMGALRKTSEHRVELRRVRVHPDFQGLGYGQKMLHFLMEKARSLGYKEMHLDTLPWQAQAQALYLKTGFQKTGLCFIEGRELNLYEINLK